MPWAADLDYHDVDAVDRIVERLDREGGRFSALLHGCDRIGTVSEAAERSDRESPFRAGLENSVNRHEKSHETRPSARRIRWNPAARRPQSPCISCAAWG